MGRKFHLLNWTFLPIYSLWEKSLMFDVLLKLHSFLVCEKKKGHYLSLICQCIAGDIAEATEFGD